MRERLTWILLGALGLVVAAALGLAMSELTSTPVGLSAEPVSAGAALAPKATPSATPRRRPRRTPTPKATPTVTAAPTVDSDDHGGDDSSGRGRGRGRSGDDD